LVRKLPFRHGVVGETHIRAGILQHQRSLEHILDGANSLHDMFQRRLIQRDRQEIMGVDARYAGPAEVVGDPVRAHVFRELLELPKVLEVERIGAADGHRDPMHNDGVAFRDLIQHVARSTARIQKVLGDELEPVDVRLLLEDVAEMRSPKANPETEVGVT
jgi:hypothetical protein